MPLCISGPTFLSLSRYVCSRCLAVKDKLQKQRRCLVLIKLLCIIG